MLYQMLVVTDLTVWIERHHENNFDQMFSDKKHLANNGRPLSENSLIANRVDQDYTEINSDCIYWVERIDISPPWTRIGSNPVSGDI